MPLHHHFVLLLVVELYYLQLFIFVSLRCIHSFFEKMRLLLSPHGGTPSLGVRKKNILDIGLQSLQEMQLNWLTGAINGSLDISRHYLDVRRGLLP